MKALDDDQDFEGKVLLRAGLCKFSLKGFSSALSYDMKQGRVLKDFLLAALATEDPDDSLLLEAPHGRNEPLINPTMWIHLTVQAAYQIVVLFLIIYAAPNTIDRYRLPSPCNTYSNIDGVVRTLL